MTDREEFLQIFRQHVTRSGSEKLLDWLDHKTDFFSAPASTRFHGACTGGLCMHSLNVYHALHDTFFTEGESEESFAICALLHDLCKANYYKAGTRNVKNETTGQWEEGNYAVIRSAAYFSGKVVGKEAIVAVVEHLVNGTEIPKEYATPAVMVDPTNYKDHVL